MRQRNIAWTSSTYWRLSLALLALVTVLWLAVSLGILVYVDFDPERAGQHGDLFGAVNALFSAWAFVGVIVAILMQKTELQLQREELSEARYQLRRSADAQQRSEAAQRRQVNCQFFAAYLNALGELRNVRPATSQSFAQRQVYESLREVIRSLDEQGQSILGFRPASIALTEHVRECLRDFDKRLDGSLRHLRGFDGPCPTQILRALTTIIRDFDRVMDNATVAALGENFQVMLVSQYGWFLDLDRAIRDRVGADELCELVEVTRESLTDLQSAVPA